MSKDKDKPLSPAEYEQFLGGFTEHLKKSKSKENPNLVLSGGLSKLSDILKSKDKTFQHLKNIEAFALKELQYAKEKREWMLKTYGAVITDLPSNEHVKKIWKEAQKGMIALDPTRYEGGEEG